MKSVSRCHINLQQQYKSSNDRQSTQTFQKNIVQRLSQTKHGKKLASPKDCSIGHGAKKKKTSHSFQKKKRNVRGETINFSFGLAFFTALSDLRSLVGH